MAIGAGHLLLPERVVRKEGVLRLHFRMAAITEFGHLLSFHFLLGPLVELVAVEAAYVTQRMCAGVPVEEGWGGCG